jgi:hypothetical protein
MSGQRMNLDHVVMFFRPVSAPMTTIAHTVGSQPPIGVRETPDDVWEKIQKAGAESEFILVQSGQLGGGKLRVAIRHVAGYGKHTSGGSGLIFGAANIAPEHVRETPEQIDSLIATAGLVLNGKALAK